MFIRYSHRLTSMYGNCMALNISVAVYIYDIYTDKITLKLFMWHNFS
jgi:hypothetical protein